MDMNASKDKVVGIAYALEVDGRTLDKAQKERPIEYIHGGNMLLPALERAIEGLSEGSPFDVTLSPEDGYGAYDAAKRFDIPKDAFLVDGKLREDLLVEGRFIPMLNSEGLVVHGKVVDVKESSVTMDFNHALAGKELHFTGEVVSVREATEKELKEGLHGEYLPPEGHCCHHGHCRHHGEGDGEHHCCHGHDGNGCRHDDDDGERHCRHGHDGKEGGCRHGEGGCAHDGDADGGHCCHND